MTVARRLAMPALFGFALVAGGGCASERPSAVPASAIVKTQGDQRVVYTSDGEGTIWIAEAGNNNINYSGPVHHGDRVVLDPDANTVTINDRVVANQGISHHDHKVYFSSAADTTAVPTVQEALVPRPPQVPAAASLKAEGRQRVEYTAAADGAVWVSDTENNGIVYAGKVVRGDKVVVDPTLKMSQFTVNGRVVYNSELPNHNRRVFFLAGADPFPGTTPDAVTAASVSTPGAVATPAAMVVRPVEVSQSATLRAEGVGRSDFVADSEGTVWVVDSSSNSVVYSGRMLRGDALMLDPTADRLTLNTRPVYDRSLVRGDRYRIFYQSTMMDPTLNHR